MKVDYTQLFDISGVEIFSVGTHKGDKYTTKDLDDMISAYADVGFTPPVKQGHAKDETGMPSLGWVHNLRRVGNKLLADFKEMPKTVYDAIKQRRYDRVSSEIYFKFMNGKKVFSKVLKAVALLGAEIPAVRDLKPLRNQVYKDGEFEFGIYSTADFNIAEFNFSGELSEAYIDKLPDESFALILPGGVKDDQGRTTPFSHRLFPHHDIDVKNTNEQNTVNQELLHLSGSKLFQEDLSTEQLASAMGHLRTHYEFLYPVTPLSEDKEYLSFKEDILKQYADQGIKLVLAELKGSASLTVQSVVFQKSDFTIEQAKEWAQKNNFKSDTIDLSIQTIRFRQKNPNRYKPGSFRTVIPGKSLSEEVKGIQILLGKTVEDETIEIGSFSFGKKLWNSSSAKEWMGEHGLEDYCSINNRESQTVEFSITKKELKKDSIQKIPLEGGSTFQLKGLLIKYDDMSGGIKMEARLAKLEEMFKNLEGESAKKLSEKDGTIETLTKEIEALKSKTSKLSEEEVKNLSEAKVKLEEKEKALAEKEENFSEIEKKNFALEESIRTNKVDDKVKGLKLPALRKYFKVFYDVATGKEVPKVFKFSVEDGKEKELSLEAITDGFAATMNKLAESKIFSELSVMPEFTREDRPVIDDPKGEVDKRTIEFMAKNKEKDYEIAFNAVLTADPQLKEAYAASA